MLLLMTGPKLFRINLMMLHPQLTYLNSGRYVGTFKQKIEGIN